MVEPGLNVEFVPQNGAHCAAVVGAHLLLHTLIATVSFGSVFIMQNDSKSFTLYGWTVCTWVLVVSFQVHRFVPIFP
jgi:hypothetical protein